jgi:uncharacterized protein (TIGR00255 family)
VQGRRQGRETRQPRRPGGLTPGEERSARVIRSMTGFGIGSAADGDVSARTEIRSVNHRHLQIKMRLPNDLGHLEPETETLVRRALERGSITITITLQREAGAGLAGVDVEAARSYQARLSELAASLNVAREIGIDTLLSLPGVIVPHEQDTERELEAALVQRSVGEAIEALIAMRSAEGRALLADLDKNTLAIEKVVARIEKRMPKAVKEHHAALVKRMNELLDGGGSRARAARAGVNPAELSRELALLADRMDTSEELARLKSHLDQWRAIVKRGTAVGRQLDFLVQELLREANTIGSKCNDATTAHAVVELKTSIERLREQVQNVE